MNKNELRYVKNDSLITRELEENAIWFNGNPTAIEYFFKKTYRELNKEDKTKVYDTMRGFWFRVGGDVPRVHSGLPALISKSWAKIIKAKTINYRVNDSDDDTNALKEILDDNNFINLLEKGIVTESWAGYFCYKVSIDTEISNYPIIELIDPRNIDVVLNRGRVSQIIVNIYDVTENGKRKVQEIFTKKDKGVKITYRTFLLKKDTEEWQEEPNDPTLDDYDSNYDMIFLKNNTSFNSRFPNSGLGESDYTNNQSLFQMLDAIISNTELDIDNAKAVKFVSEAITKVVENTDIGVQEKNVYDKNETVVILSNTIMQDDSFDVRKLISILQPLVRVADFNATAKEITGRILANSSISPASIGLPGFDSIDSAADSQRARKEITITARNEKVSRWSQFLPKFFIELLHIHDEVMKKPEKDYDVKVEFDSYETPYFEELVKTVAEAVQGGVMSRKQAVEKLYPDLTEEEVKQTVLDIKGETLTPFIASDL